MAPLSAPPTTEALSKAAGEEVGKKYEVNIAHNRTAALFALNDRINVYLESSDKPVAVLRFGGQYSGALWLGGDLVGEFRKDPSGSFVVVEIENGFKRSAPLTGADPIKYLLDLL